MYVGVDCCAVFSAATICRMWVVFYVLFWLWKGCRELLFLFDTTAALTYNMHQSWLLRNLLHTIWPVWLNIYYACCTSCAARIPPTLLSPTVDAIV